jgi:hypothetical protein
MICYSQEEWCGAEVVFVARGGARAYLSRAAPFPAETPSPQGAHTEAIYSPNEQQRSVLLITSCVRELRNF